MQVAQTPRLILRQLTEDDASFILVLLNTQGFIDNIGDKGVRSLVDAREYIASGPVKSYQEHGFGLFAVVLADNGFPIGMCGLIKRPTLDNVDLGYAFLPQYWGQGYAFEAAKASLELGKSLGIERIVAIVSSHNDASKSLLNKLGMQFETTLQLTPDDEPVELFS
ncbi:GNAT family N-acetyltransferase [Shewanella acanthi]|uniref:GNAT family N-acetyltransferase n=1 Tax=Shewanella acanthi TaxID=2864212 RepID=UPI001C65D2AC|nr:GNAT family N-acetyltransferase [Shewanella acanthi]QYJ77580.1 GNAT family N-acetyltransferase [Shewanella acanthi]